MIGALLRRRRRATPSDLEAHEADTRASAQRYSAFTLANVFDSTDVGAAPSAASTSFGTSRSALSVASRRELAPTVNVAVAVSVTPPALPVTLSVIDVPVPTGGTVKRMSRLRVCPAASDK